MRELFDGVSLDVKSVVKKVEKADAKRAMPFVQELKRKLEAGEGVERVFGRELGFDEVEVLRDMVPVLKSTVPKLKEVNIVVIGEGGQGGGAEDVGKAGTRSAEPGSPSIDFQNL